MNTNIWNHTPTVAIWAGSLTLLCFAGGLLLKRKWTAGLAVAVTGPVILLPMAFAGGLGSLALGEIFVRGFLDPYGLGAGAQPWVYAFADSVMMVTPFAMLLLYVRYERAFNRVDRVAANRAAARLRMKNFSLPNPREMHFRLRRSAAPKFVLPPRRGSRHHHRAGKRAILPKLPRRLARHPRPVIRPAS